VKIYDVLWPKLMWGYNNYCPEVMWYPCMPIMETSLILYFKCTIHFHQKKIRLFCLLKSVFRLFWCFLLYFSSSSCLFVNLSNALISPFLFSLNSFLPFFPFFGVLYSCFSLCSLFLYFKFYFSNLSSYSCSSSLYFLSLTLYSCHCYSSPACLRVLFFILYFHCYIAHYST